jgi:hypothetical protein
VGTNDIKDDSKSAEVVTAEILNLGHWIKDKLPDTNVSISGITVRKDKASVNNKINRSFSSDVTAAILVYQNNEMAAILVYGTGISSFLFKYFVFFHHPTGATDHVSENDL